MLAGFFPFLLLFSSLSGLMLTRVSSDTPVLIAQPTLLWHSLSDPLHPTCQFRQVPFQSGSCPATSRGHLVWDWWTHKATTAPNAHTLWTAPARITSQPHPACLQWLQEGFSASWTWGQPCPPAHPQRLPHTTGGHRQPTWDTPLECLVLATMGDIMLLNPTGCFPTQGHCLQG